MNKTNERLQLTSKQYWVYFAIPVLLALPAFLINITLAYYYLFPNYEVAIHQWIWTGNIWFAIALFSFINRWNALYFYQISVQLSNEEFQSTCKRVANKFDWQLLSNEHHYKTFYRIEKQGYKEEYIVIKHQQDKIHLTSITNPNRLHLSPFQQNIKNILHFKNSILKINLPQSAFEKKINLGLFYNQGLARILQNVFYLLILIVGAIPFYIGLNLLLASISNKEMISGGIFFFGFGLIMLIGYFKITK